MLKKVNRLSSDFDFKRVRKYGHAYQNPYFSLTFLKVTDQKPARIGFIISTKISKSAAKRNQIKRAMRLQIEEVINQIASEMLLVFWLKPKSVEAEPEELKKAVLKALGDTRLI